MTNALTSEAATGSGDRSRPRAALPALCLTQVVSWGIVYYAFPVLNPQVTHATGWPDRTTARAEIFTFIETFYNRKRLRKHPVWGYLTLLETRQRHEQEHALAA